jgi:hypothetical protein
MAPFVWTGVAILAPTRAPNIFRLCYIDLYLPDSNLAAPANLTRNSFATKNQAYRLKTTFSSLLLVVLSVSCISSF